MIFVECYPDTILVQIAGRIPSRDVIHEIKGKGAICARLDSRVNCTALIDQDPGSSQPPYLSKLTLQKDITESDIKVFKDISRQNLVVILAPKLEDWILRASSLAKLNPNDYGLPSDIKELHRVINYRLEKFQRLVEDLIEAKSPMLKSLQSVL